MAKKEAIEEAPQESKSSKPLMVGILISLTVCVATGVMILTSLFAS